MNSRLSKEPPSFTWRQKRAIVRLSFPMGSFFQVSKWSPIWLAFTIKMASETPQLPSMRAETESRTITHQRWFSI